MFIGAMPSMTAMIRVHERRVGNLGLPEGALEQHVVGDDLADPGKQQSGPYQTQAQQELCREQPLGLTEQCQRTAKQDDRAYGGDIRVDVEAVVETESSSTRFLAHPNGLVRELHGFGLAHPIAARGAISAFDEVAVPAAERHQLIVAAEFRDSTVFEEGDLVRIANRRQPMRDEKDDAMATPLGEVGHQARFRLGVERSSRFVQDQNRRVADDCPGDGQPLGADRWRASPRVRPTRSRNPCRGRE